jgi:hypothetical protein
MPRAICAAGVFNGNDLLPVEFFSVSGLGDAPRRDGFGDFGVGIVAEIRM